MDLEPRNAELATLRARAEFLLSRSDTEFARTSPQDVKRLVYELKIYQLELELQNEELRRTQVELAESRDRFSELYDFAPIGYVSIGPKGAITSANLRAAELFGVPRPLLIKKWFSSFIAGEDADQLYLHYKAVRGSTETQTCELRLKNSECPRFIRLESTRDPSEDASDASLRVAVTEVTELRREAGARMELQEEFHQAERLKTLGIIAGGVAHDFNNLLVPILGYAELTANLANQDSTIIGYMKQITNAAERAASLCVQMHDYSQSRVHRRTPVDLVKVVRDFVDVFQNTTNFSVILRTDFLAPHVPVHADITQIGRVLVNLLTNAAEAIGENDGTVTVAVGSVSLDDVELECLAVVPKSLTKRMAYVEVKDDGCGMDKQVRERIFDPFYSSKLYGRGLGMASVYGVVVAHEGGILLESQPEYGTVIRILLPCDDSSPPDDSSI